MPSVTRKSSTTRRARRAAMVAQMLPVTEALLRGGEPFTALSVERLINAAGVSRATFYVYFEDKGTLLLALAEDVMERVVAAAGRWWELEDDAGHDDVEAALRHIVDVFGDHVVIWGALVDASSYDANVRASFRGVVDGAAAQLASHIRDGQKRGSVRSGLDPKRTAEWLTWMTERGLYQLLSGASKAEIGKLCRALSDIVWATLYEGAMTRTAAP